VIAETDGDPPGVASGIGDFYRVFVEVGEAIGLALIREGGPAFLLKILEMIF
jgi:hypothetical protein